MLIFFDILDILFYLICILHCVKSTIPYKIEAESNFHSLMCHAGVYIYIIYGIYSWYSWYIYIIKVICMYIIYTLLCASLHIHNEGV